MKITKRTQNGDAKTAVNWSVGGRRAEIAAANEANGGGFVKKSVNLVETC